VTLDVSGIRFGYDGEDALRDVTLRIAGGEVTCIVGPNASGKTTLLKCMNRLLVPYCGEVSLDGRNMRKMRTGDIAKRIGYVPQSETAHVPVSVFETVLLGRKPHAGWVPSRHDLEKTARTIERLDIAHIAMRNANALSGGQQRKVTIGRALAQEPGILLLDEPTASLDIRHALDILELIKSQAVAGRAVVMSIHDLTLASRYCDKVIMMKEGKIHAAGGREIFTREIIREVYGIEAKVIHDPEAGAIVVPLRAKCEGC
jgi:iron complex transport system ATP-binding protein